MAQDSSLRDLLRGLAASDPGSHALALMLQGRGREARESARAAVELQPSVPSHHLRLVIVELSQGRKRQARKAAERLTQLAPSDRLSAVAMALVLLAEHRWLEAEAVIGPVLHARPDDEPAVWVLALAFEGEGRRDAALERFAWLRARGRQVSPDVAGESLWRTWRWYELAVLGLMATLLVHLAIEAFRTPYEGFVGRMLAIALVVTVAGLLLIVRRRRMRFASLSEEARTAIAAESSRRQLHAFLETAPRALVIGGIIVALLLWQRALADASVPFEELKVGTCFDWPPETVTPRVAPIPCDRPHHLELIAVVPYPAAEEAPYPGTATLMRYGDEHCRRAFGPYVGVPFEQQSALAVDARFAIESYWRGHHDIYCTIRAHDWDKLVSSFRGAGL